MPKRSTPVFKINDFQHLQEGRDVYANRLPDHLQHHHFIHEPHKHDFYLAVLFTRGSGTHEIDFSSYKVKPGSLFLLSPGQTHNWKLSRDTDGYVFFHSPEFYNLNFRNRQIRDYPFFSSLYHSPLLQLKDKALKKTEALFAEILEEFEKNKPMKLQKLGALIDILYIELSRKYEATPEIAHHEGYQEKLRKLQELIDANYRTIKSPAEYAEKMGMSEKHLNRICKTLLNKTTTDLITDRVILEAKRLLVQGGNSVAGIAGELGYFDASYFTRLFKKKTGETPASFLKQRK